MDTIDRERRYVSVGSQLMATKTRSRKKSKRQGGRHSQREQRGQLARPSRHELKEIAARTYMAGLLCSLLSWPWSSS